MAIIGELIACGSKLPRLRTLHLDTYNGIGAMAPGPLAALFESPIGHQLETFVASIEASQLAAWREFLEPRTQTRLELHEPRWRRAGNRLALARSPAGALDELRFTLRPKTAPAWVDDALHDIKPSVLRAIHCSGCDASNARGQARDAVGRLPAGDDVRLNEVWITEPPSKTHIAVAVGGLGGWRSAEDHRR